MRKPFYHIALTTLLLPALILGVLVLEHGNRNLASENVTNKNVSANLQPSQGKKSVEFEKVVLTQSPSFNFSVLGVAVNELEKKGIVTPFEFTVYKAKKGDVYLDTSSYKETSFQIAVAMAKEYVKYFLHLPLDDKNVLIKLMVNSPFVAGESGGVALTLGLIFAAKGAVPKNLDNYVFTGVIMPFGIIGEVGGIDLKYLAAKEEGKILVHGNPTFMQGMFFTNILDLYKTLFGEQLLQKKNITVPSWYTQITKKLADQICSKAKEYNFTASPLYKDYLKAEKDKAYYAMASICFRYLMENSTVEVNPADVSSELINLREEMNNAMQKVKTLYDAEALAAAQERLKMAINYYNEYLQTGDYKYLTKAYWRLESAKGWLEFVGNTTGPKPYCPLDVYKEEKKIYAAVLPNIELPQITNDTSCYYEVKSVIANIHNYLFNYPSNVEALIKIAPYYFDRFDLIGYTSYELSKYLTNIKDKLYFIVRAIDFMHNYELNPTSQ